MNVGFIGLGTMGTPMVLNLLKHGHVVKVRSAHLDSGNVRLAVRHGAVVAASPRAVASGSEVVMLSLPRAEASEKVVLGIDGVLQGADATAADVTKELSEWRPRKGGTADLSSAFEFLEKRRRRGKGRRRG